MGYAGARSVTAIGDPVNTASRLEAMNKDFASQLIVSKKVARRADLDLSSERLEVVPCAGEPIRCRSTFSTTPPTSKRRPTPSR